MTAKLQISSKSPIPAGIFSGIEAFWYNDEKWVIAHGEVRRFDECDSSIQQPIWKAFLNDKQSLGYLSKIGIKKASESFDRWFRCVVGGLDAIPDVLNDKFTPDTFVNTCADNHCPHRGKLCSCAAGLLNYEVETIAALQTARNMQHAAESIHISLPAIKSRIEKLHIKLDVNNSIAMMHRAAQLGI